MPCPLNPGIYTIIIIIAIVTITTIINIAAILILIAIPAIIITITIGTIVSLKFDRPGSDLGLGPLGRDFRILPRTLIMGGLEGL